MIILPPRVVVFVVVLTTITGSVDAQPPVKPSVALPGRAVTFDRRITGVQPMCGLVLWSDHPQVSTDAVTLEFRYWGYDEIAVGPAQYDFSNFDRYLDEVAKRGHQAVVRFRFVYPGRTTTVPEWIRDQPGYQATIGRSEGKRTHFCDWSHESLRQWTLDFYQRFADRYDDDPRIAYLQTGFGLWAEYHIYDGPRKLGRTFPAKAFQTQFLEHLDSVFDHLPWSISIDAADNAYSPIQADPKLMRLNFGVFDDSFLCQQHAQENERNWMILDQHRWRRAPAGGEISYYTRRDQQLALSPNGPHGIAFSDLANRFHITYMIANDQPNYQTMDTIRQVGMALGYRFAVTSASLHNNDLHLRVTNRGLAPIYRDAFFAVRADPQSQPVGRTSGDSKLLRGALSLRGVLPGEHRHVIIRDGAANHDTLHITSDFLVPGQQIEFETP